MSLILLYKNSNTGGLHANKKKIKKDWKGKFMATTTKKAAPAKKPAAKKAAPVKKKTK